MNPPALDFSQFKFAPVIALPAQYDIYDFSQGYNPERNRTSPYGIGRYNERRPGMYNTNQFSPGSQKARDIHVGIDIAAPVGCEVRAFFDGVIFLSGINDAAGDYGGTIITEHRLGEHVLWALHGHLSHASARKACVGAKFKAGDVLGHLGDSSENGGWNPHLHFQLSWQRPERCDLPGAVNEKDLPSALSIYPDPRLVLGPLY